MPWETEVKESRIARYGSDVKSVVITLSHGNYKIDSLTIIDKDGVERTKFGEGEEVHFKTRVSNHGDIKETGLLRIIDTDTGEEIDIFSVFLDPGRYIEFSHRIGTAIDAVMPNHDWHLNFSITP